MNVQEKTKQNITYFLLAFFIVGITFAIIQAMKIFNRPSEYMIAKNGRITNYENVIAYVIRDEEIINTDDYEGERKIIIGDTNKVAKGDVVFTFIENEEDDVKQKIAEIDNRIQEILDEEINKYVQEMKPIDKKASNDLYLLTNDRENFGSIKDIKDKIEDELYTKVSTIGDMSSKNSEIKKLINEKNDYEKNRYSYKKDYKTEKSGLISYRVDGYEDYLTPLSFSKINLDYLKDIKCITDQAIPISSNKTKIIDNFYTYLALVTKSEDSKNVKLNDSLKISLDGSISNYSKGTVEYIIDEDEEARIIIVKILDNTEYLSKYRKVSADIIWWNYEGIKVQNDALYDVEIKDDETGEILSKAKALKVLGTTDYQKEVLVKIESQTADFSIINNYTDEELIELGLSRSYVNDRNKINLYDRVVLN